MNIKKILLAVLIFLFSSAIAHAQKPKPSTPLEKSLLWEISGNGLKAPSYLFGTYHFADKKFADSLVVIGEKFKTCKAIVCEVVIDSSISAKMMPAMVLTNNSLDKVFTPHEYALISDSIRSLTQLELSSFNSFKPAVVDMTLLYYFTPQTISPTNPPIEQYFQDEGKKHGYKIIGLETVEFQSDLLFNAPLEEQKAHLLRTANKIREQKKILDDGYNIYRQQDIERIDREMLSDGEFTPEELDKMVKKRNVKWVDQLPLIMRAQAAFIAVGAAHLPGQYGLINQLRLKGYTVKPVSPLTP